MSHLLLVTSTYVWSSPEVFTKQGRSHEPILPMQIGPTSQNSVGKWFHDGLTLSNFHPIWNRSHCHILNRNRMFQVAVTIAVGGGPSGPSTEGPFCCAVHLCRALSDSGHRQTISSSHRSGCLYWAMYITPITENYCCFFIVKRAYI